MMKSTLKMLLAFAAVWMTSTAAVAQEPCDCPEDEPVLEYCVIDLNTGEQLSVESTACDLFCEGYFLFWEGPCDDGPGGGGPGGGDPTDCDCDGTEEPQEWCVYDPFFGEGYTVVATECELLCEGIFSFSEGPCDDEWDPWPTDCDCDYDVYEPVCVTFDDGTSCSFFNACEAECFGYTDYTEGECEYVPGDCGCPEDEPVEDYCVIDLWTGEQSVVSGTECELFCEGYLIIGYGDCEDGGGDPYDPCDCPEDEPVEDFCVLDFETGEIVTVTGTECELFCEGFIVVGYGDCEDVEEPNPCDCDGTEEPQEWCIFDPFFGEGYTVVATECELLCEGIFGYSEGACEDWDPWPTDCDCDYDVYEPVCVTFDDGTSCTFFNACEAECFGYTDYSEGECEYDWDPTDCGCPDEEPVEEFCVIDFETGEISTVSGGECALFCEGYLIIGYGDCEDVEEPNPCDCDDTEEPQEWCIYDPFFGEGYTVVATECELLCEGIFSYSEGPCDEWDPSDCGCPDEEVADYCVINLNTGDLEVVTGSECQLFCDGYIVVGEGDCEDIETPDPCDCPDEEVMDFCVLDFETGEVTIVTGTFCELSCEGAIIIGEGDCEDGTGGGDPVDPCDCPEEDAADYCVLNLNTGDVEIMTGTFCELLCEGFLVVGEGDCEGFDDGEDDEDGGTPPMAALQDWTEGFTVSEVGIYPNPADQVVNLTFKASAEGVLNVEIYSLTGQLLQAEQWTANGGSEVRELNLQDLASGLYTVALTTTDGIRTSVQVMKR